MNVGSFSHRRTCSIRLSWMGFRCSRVRESPCSTSSTKRSLAGTFSGYGLFQNSEKGGFCRGCLGGRGRNRNSSIQELEDSRTQELKKPRDCAQFCHPNRQTAALTNFRLMLVSQIREF